MLLALVSCSKEDEPEIREEFLRAEVNGESFSADKKTGIVFIQKQLTSQGTINLLLSGKTREGKSLEMVVYNYHGKKKYTIGRKNSLNHEHFLNYNWCQYFEETTGLFWSTVNNHYTVASLPGYIEISEDDGSFLSGIFAFDAFDTDGLNARNVSEGNFYLKLQP